MTRTPMIPMSTLYLSMTRLLLIKKVSEQRAMEERAKSARVSVVRDGKGRVIACR